MSWQHVQAIVATSLKHLMPVLYRIRLVHGSINSSCHPAYAFHCDCCLDKCPSQLHSVCGGGTVRESICMYLGL